VQQQYSQPQTAPATVPNVQTPLDARCPEEVCRKLREHEKISNIMWLVVGILQVLAIFTILAGAWNIYRSIVGLKGINNIVPGNSSLENHYEKQLTWIILGLVWNVLFGAVLGAGLCIYDLWIRNYALSNKHAFY
jgi:hypothetical protein